MQFSIWKEAILRKKGTVPSNPAVQHVSFLSLNTVFKTELLSEGELFLTVLLSSVVFIIV